MNTTTDALRADAGRGVGEVDGTVVSINGSALIQSIASGDDISPVAQALQYGALELEANIFTEHLVQEVAPEAEYIPAGQSAHEVPYFPALHTGQRIAPAVGNVMPMGQSEHVVDATFNVYLPRLH